MDGEMEEEVAKDKQEADGEQEVTPKRTPKRKSNTPSKGRPRKSPAKAGASDAQNPCHFLRGEYLAVRNESGLYINLGFLGALMVSTQNICRKSN